MAKKATPETKKVKAEAKPKKVATTTKTVKAAAPKKAAVDDKEPKKVAKKAAKAAAPKKEAVAKKATKAAPKKAVAKKAVKPAAAKKEAAPKKAAAKAVKPAKKVAVDPDQELLDAIVDGILDKKGHDILVLDLRPTGNSVADWFVISHGKSNTQADAIADSVEESVRKKLGYKPWHTEGFQNAEWILLDYVNVVVHVFQEPIRDFYRLEDLWADAPTVKIKESFGN